MKEDLNTEKEQKIIYEKLAKRAAENLNKMGINAHYSDSKEEALSMALGMIPEGATVGTADSVTLLQVGVFSALRKRGKNEIINPFVRDESGHFIMSEEERDETKRKAMHSDVFVVGTNAVTLDGKLINVDGDGNRVASVIFGPKKVIIIAGANKIVKDVGEGV